MTSWEAVYATKDAAERSWTETGPSHSLPWVLEDSPQLSRSIVDIGGGASRLADSLVARGFTNVTVLDLSPSALEEVRGRLGDAVQLVVANVLEWDPPQPVDLWHDRAVFHFFVEPEEQLRYVDRVTRAVREGGTFVLATFAPNGPEQCSGLPVTRWSAAELEDRFSQGFQLLQSEEHLHVTPWGANQPFTWVRFRRFQ